MDKEFLKKKVIPIAVIVVVSFVVVQIFVSVLFWVQGLYFTWLFYVLWWLVLLWVIQLYLKKKHDIPNIFKAIWSIKSKKIRIGILVLLALPIVYASSKGIARDVRLANARALRASDAAIYEMVKEASDGIIANYDESKVVIKKSVSNLLDHKIVVEVDGRKLVLYRDKKYVLKFGKLKSYSDWTAVWED